MNEKKYKLGTLIRFKTGINASRVSPNLRNRFYVIDDLLSDLAQQEGKEQFPELPSPYETVKSGQIVLDLVSGKAAIVTKGTENKLLRNTVAKCDIIENALDPWFLCYFFNESKELKNARASTLVASVRFLTVTGLQDLWVSFPPLDKQRAIGMVYKDFCRLRWLKQRQDELFSTIVLQAISKTRCVTR
jgi:hypothetical protein